MTGGKRTEELHLLIACVIVVPQNTNSGVEHGAGTRRPGNVQA
jgi:hypothetical protein